MAKATDPFVRARQFVEKIRRDRSGVTAIEFAFATPLFLTLTLGGIELANLALAHMRVSQMAMTVADNAGRVTAGIDEANIREVFEGAKVISKGIEFEDHGRMVLSSLEENGRAGQRQGQVIRWQRCWGNNRRINPAYGREGDGKNDSSLRAGLGSRAKITAAPDTAVMFVEAQYDYQPLIWTAFLSSRVIRYESAFNVRGRQVNTIANGGGIPPSRC